MKPKLLVKLSNIIGVISIILLVYWVFVFIVTEVFGLKVFRQNMSDTFYMSIMGILALMAGALMINVMFNLTRIADKQNVDDTYKSKKMKKMGLLFIFSFPLILSFLVGGDYLTSRKKEKMLISSAESIVNDNRGKIEPITDYSFSLPWLHETENTLELLSKKDKNFPNIEVIVEDSIDNTHVYLQYSSSSIYIDNDSIRAPKRRYIRSTTKEERDYLLDVFQNKTKDNRFSSHNGSYELFYPYEKNGKIVVFYFSEYQRYGKMGS